MPVSYTHLDVYKRQVLSDGKSQDNLPYAPSEVAKATVMEYEGKTYITYDNEDHVTDEVTLSPSSEPVSYTHLDVYKRQIYECNSPKQKEFKRNIQSSSAGKLCLWPGD